MTTVKLIKSSILTGNIKLKPVLILMKIIILI